MKTPQSNKEVKQEIFDLVAVHLFTQGERSMLNKVSCAYRSKGGLRCAIGCLIADDNYSSTLECKPAEDCRVLDALPIRFQVYGRFLRALQLVHDNENSWLSELHLKLRFDAIAAEFGLDASIVSGLTLNAKVEA